MIAFAENLHEVLPKSYLGNLALLSDEQRSAIAEDLRRWKLAHEMFSPQREASSESTKKAAIAKIKNSIEALTPEGYREDMRKRLNILRIKHK